MSEYITSWLDDIDMAHVSEEIVRCRDCKHLRRDGDYRFCMLAARELDGGSGFCAWGERRDA